MVDQSDFIKNLSLKEKIEILLDKNLWLDSQLNDTLPKKKIDLFTFEEMQKDLSVFSFAFRSWNLELIKSLAEVNANKTKDNGKRMVIIPFGFFESDHYSFAGIDSLSEQPFFLYKMLYTYIKTLRDHDIYVMAYVKENINNAYYKLLNKLNFNGIIVDDEQLVNVLTEQDFILIENSDDSETTYSLKNSVINNFSSQEKLEDALQLYTENLKLLEESKINQKDFNQLIEDQQILNTDFVDNLILKIDYLIECAYPKNDEKLESVNDNIDDFYRYLTTQSTVNIKCIKTLCSSLSSSNVYLVGDFNIQKDTIEELATQYFPKFKQIYNGEQTFFIDHPLSESAETKNKSMEAVIVKLNSINDKDFLTDPQVVFLEKLFESDFNVILILPPQIKEIDQRWDQYCSMILSSEIYNKASLQGIFDIISGKTKASGELNIPITKSSKDNHKSHLFYGLESKDISFTNLHINLPIIQYMLKNNSNENEEIVTKIYLANKDSDQENKMLLGFNKIILSKQKSRIVSVEILENDLEFYDLSHDSEYTKKYAYQIFYLDQNKLSLEHNKKSKDINLNLITFKIFGMPLLHLMNTILVIALILGLMFALNYIYFIVVLSLFAIINIINKIKNKRLYKSKEKPSAFDYQKLQDALSDIPFAQATHEEIFEQVADENNLEENMDEDSEDIEEETINIIRPKEVIPAENIFYNRSINISEYLNKAKKYFSESGLDLNINSIKEFFSEIASSQLLLSIDNHALITDRFIEIFSEYIGGKMFFDYLEPEIDRVDHLLNEEDSGLSRCIQSANDNSNIIHFMILNDVDLSKSNEVLANIMEYARDPFITTSLYKVSEGQYIDLPKNIWFIVQPKSKDRFLMTNRLSTTSFSFTLDYAITEPNETVNENEEKMSYHFLKNYTQKSKDTHYIDEITWKKLDEIDRFAKKRDLTIFDNRITREVENYSAMYLSSGGEVLDAVDNVLYSKVLNIIQHFDLSTPTDDDTDLFTLCENLFGLENLKKTKHLLTKIKEKNLSEGDQ